MIGHAVRWNSSSPRLSALSLAIAVALGSPLASAATITVTSAADPLPTSSSSTCTLRQAVATINNQAVGGANTGNCANSGGAFGTSDAIVFAPAVTAINLDGTTNGELDIGLSHDLLINGGTSLGQVTVSLASGTYSVIGTRGSNTASNLTLTGLTITGGNSDRGGGVYLTPSGNTLTLNNSVVTSNFANYAGGGVYAYNVVANNSTISNNTAGAGGGIFAYKNYGLVQLNNSLVSGNYSAIVAGGIYAPHITSNHSTVSDNTSSYAGGGVLTEYGGTFSDSIISGNTLVGPRSSDNPFGYYVSGGGVLAGGDVTFTNTTVSNNSVSSEYGPALGGGAATKYSNGSLTFANSTISGNNGGAVLAYKVVLTNSTVNGNYGTTYGPIQAPAGVYAASQLGLFNSTVSGNMGPGPALGLAASESQPAPLLPKPGTGHKRRDALRKRLHLQGNDHLHGAAQTRRHAGGTQAVGIHGHNLQAANLASNLTLYSSIVTENTGTYDIYSRSGGVVAAGGFNILGNVSNTISLASLTNEVVGSPLLGALADNGCGVKAGETSTLACVQTMALQAGSPALNKGSTVPSGVTTDERGTGFARPSGPAADIGAFEVLYVPPTATPLVENVSFNTPLTFSLQGSDANPGGPFPFTFASATAPTHGTITINPSTGSTTYTPTAGFTGTDTFTYTVTDANGTSTPATVTLHVAAGALPIAQPNSASTAANTPVNIILTATDANAGTSPFSFAIGTPPAHGTVVLGVPTTTGNSTPSGSSTIQFSYGIAASNGTVTATYTPAFNYGGPDSFTFTASNANGTSLPATVSLAVAAPLPATPAPIPTLSTWAWSALIAQFGLIAWYRLRRFPAAAPKKSSP